MCKGMGTRQNKMYRCISQKQYKVARALLLTDETIPFRELANKRSSHREVFCKKGVLFYQEGLSLVLADIYHQNRSFSQVDKAFSQVV